MTVDQSMSIGQVLRMDPDTAEIFQAFGMHCLGCPHATGESILQASAVHGVEAAVLVEKLNEYLAGKA